jgi:hypothetical protein
MIVSNPTKRRTKGAKASATVPALEGMEFLDFRLEKAAYLQPVLGDPGDGEPKEVVRIGHLLIIDRAQVRAT